MLYFDKLEWALAQLPEGPGQLQFKRDGHKLTGLEHGKQILELEPDRICLISPEVSRTDLQGLEHIQADHHHLILEFADRKEKLHSPHAGQIAQLMNLLLTPADKDLETEEALLHQAETGRPEAIKALVAYYHQKGHTEKESRWKSLYALHEEKPKEKDIAMEDEIRREYEQGAQWQKEEQDQIPSSMSADDLMLTAKNYAKVNDRQNELTYLKHAANLSHPDAHFQLATYYASGMYGHPANPKRAMAHMSEAGQLGHKDAPYYLGVWNRNGFGTSRDLDQAKHWLEKDETVKGQVQLALLYGDDLHDYEKAIETAKKTMEQTSVDKTREILQKKTEAWKQKKQQREQEKHKWLRMAEIFENAKEYDLSLEYFQKAADLGSLEATYHLGLQYLLGEGCAVNKDLAKLLLEKSKESQPESLYYLTYLETDPEKQKAYAKAYLNTNASKVRQDEVRNFLHVDGKTVRHLLQEGKVQEAANMLNIMDETDKTRCLNHLKQEAFEQADEAFTIAVLQLAAENGDDQAISIYGQALLESGDERAIPFLIENCARNHGDACALMALAYSEGLQVKPDRNKAKEYWDRAVKLQSNLAKQWSWNE